MRVLYLSNAAQIGGANRALLTLWAGLGAHGVSPAAACPADGPMVQACTAAGVPCDVLPYEQPSWREPVRTLRATRRWRSLLTRVRPDLIHANDFHNARSISLAAGVRRTPVVCHVRFHQNEAYLRWVFRGLPKPRAFIHNSHATRRLVEPALREACPRAAHVVIHNGVSLDRFRPPADSGRDGRRLRVGIVGNLIPIKGHLDFLEMARALTEDGLDLEYWIVGEDIHGTGHRHALEARVRELDLESRVVFLGHRSDIPDLLRQLDVLVCASHVEPFGINVIEGMACELPVVGTSVGGIPEIIEDGVTGWLVPPRDPARLAHAVRALIADPARRRTMGRLARERVRAHFSDEQHTAAVVNLYRTILEHPRGALNPHAVAGES
jgi:glycosyltransferase involved in cell wall biosynthesis